jgi:hypothetical protein
MNRCVEIQPDSRITDHQGHEWSWAYRVFRTIPAREGYRADSDGNIWSCRYRPDVGFRWRRLKPQTIGHKGYHFVRLFNGDGRPRCESIHTLVLRAFYGPPPDGMEACHRNGKRGDNRPLNLYWGTHLQNCADREAHGNQWKGSKVTVSKLKEEDIPEIFTLLAEGWTRQDIGLLYGVSDVLICNIANGKSWKHITAKLAGVSEG